MGTVKTLDISEATGPLADYVRPGRDETVVITVDGEPAYAIIPLQFADHETISLSTNPEFLETLARARQEIREGRGISSSEVRRRLGISAE